MIYFQFVFCKVYMFMDDSTFLLIHDIYYVSRCVKPDSPLVGQVTEIRSLFLCPVSSVLRVQYIVPVPILGVEVSNVEVWWWNLNVSHDGYLLSIMLRQSVSLCLCSPEVFQVPFTSNSFCWYVPKGKKWFYLSVID